MQHTSGSPSGQSAAAKSIPLGVIERDGPGQSRAQTARLGRRRRETIPPRPADVDEGQVLGIPAPARTSSPAGRTNYIGARVFLLTPRYPSHARGRAPDHPTTTTEPPSRVRAENYIQADGEVPRGVTTHRRFTGSRIPNAGPSAMVGGRGERPCASFSSSSSSGIRGGRPPPPAP